MDKINLNFYGVNYQKQVDEKKETKAEEKKEAPAQQENKNLKADDVLNAMALTGAQNVTFAGLNRVNPKDHLDDASISRIQNSMPAFENMLENYMNIIEGEFPNLSEAQKQSLAYKAVLKGM